MARENGADLFRASERLVEHHASATRVGEDGVDAGVFEGLDEKVAAHGGGGQLGLAWGDLLGR